MPEPDVALVDVDRDGEVALGGDHPGVGEGLAVALELRGAGLGDHRRAGHVEQAACRCPEVTTPRSIARSAAASLRGQRRRRRPGRTRRPTAPAAARRSCPAWIDAITVAIAIGEARTVPWPIRSAAASVSDCGRRDAARSTPGSRGRGRPRGRATRRRRRGRRRRALPAWEMKAVLQELATRGAQRDLADARCSGSRRSSRTACRRRRSVGVHGTTVSGVSPARSSARLLTRLERRARARTGRRSRCCSRRCPGRWRRPGSRRSRAGSRPARSPGRRRRAPLGRRSAGRSSRVSSQRLARLGVDPEELALLAVRRRPR